jgi:diguanylate cyclase
MTTELESERARADTAERQRKRYQQAFLSILNEGFTDLDRTVNKLLEILSTTLDVDRVGFWVFNDPSDAIQCTHQYQRRPPMSSTPMVLKRDDHPFYFSAVSTHLTLAIQDTLNDARTKDLIQSYLMPLGVTAMLDVPVRAFGKCIGVVCHEYIDGVRNWSAEDQQFAAGVATQIALAFERDQVKQAQEKLLKRSLFDHDTGLPNYINFENTVAQRLAGDSQPCIVVVTRIDQYKLVADAFGRQQSVRLLNLVAKRLSSAMPAGIELARTAPDEFAVVISDIEPSQLMAAIAQRVALLRDPVVLGDESIFLTLSTGFAKSDVVGADSAEELITDARLALFEARRQGGGRVVAFTPSLRERVTERVVSEQDLRRGLAAQEFVMFFQPIMDLVELRCIGVEALLRWQHPTRGLLGPSDFLSSALDTGIIIPLGRQALRAACEGIAQIRAQTQNPNLTVSINMSAPELLALSSEQSIFAELDRLGLFPDAISIEVTEAALLTDLDHASAVLASIKEAGVRVSLDDFGTAFSSLSWLHKLPIDTVKIDRGFVEGIPGNSRSTALVRAIAELSRALDRNVIAEGIETEEQLKAIVAMGVTQGQGFLFSAAESVESYTPLWLQRLEAHQ